MTLDPNHLDQNHDNPPSPIGDAHVQPESICNKLKEILNKELSEGSEAELKLRQEINKHISECKLYSCYLEKINRINKGLY